MILMEVLGYIQLAFTLTLELLGIVLLYNLIKAVQKYNREH